MVRRWRWRSRPKCSRICWWNWWCTGPYAGGGNGANSFEHPTATQPATFSTGTYATGGGGGSNSAFEGGSGGSGIVVVRYEIGSSQSGSAKATGGSISYFGGKTIHTFTNSGDFNVTTGPLSVEYLVVGGGGGGASAAGGGGAGAYRTATGLTVNPGPNSVVVAAGGGGSNNQTISSTPGGDSSFTASSTITSNGGGGASNYTPGTPSDLELVQVFMDLIVLVMDLVVEVLKDGFRIATNGGAGGTYGNNGGGTPSGPPHNGAGGGGSGGAGGSENHKVETVVLAQERLLHLEIQNLPLHQMVED